MYVLGQTGEASAVCTFLPLVWLIYKAVTLPAMVANKAKVRNILVKNLLGFLKNLPLENGFNIYCFLFLFFVCFDFALIIQHILCLCKFLSKKLTSGKLVE